MIPVIVSCPALMRGDANAYAMAMGTGPHYGTTYGDPLLQDPNGNTYARTGFTVPLEWITAAQGTLQRPAWDVEPYAINMAGARRAQDALVFWTPDMGGDAPLARPGALVAIGGVDGPAALAMMGLAPIPVRGPV